MATIEEVKQDVLEVLKEEHGIECVNAWPIGPRHWQAADANGQVYNLRW